MSPGARIRLLFAVAFVVGAGMVASNFWDMSAEGRYAPSSFILGGMLLAVSPFVVIVGRPTDPRTGRQPLWWNVVTGALGCVGTAVGVWFSFFVAH